MFVLLEGLLEDSSTTRPPLFNDSNYNDWKTGMNIYLQIVNYNLWEVVVEGPYTPPKQSENGTVVRN